MDIVVCVKPVPDPKQWSKLSLDPETKILRREGVETIVNPLDKHALEIAMQLREKHGGSVRVVSMAPPFTVEVLRETLALGADEVFLLSDRAFAGADSWATVLVLAAGIRHMGTPDLVLCGAESADGSTGQVGPQIAHLLGFSHLTFVCGVEEASLGQGSDHLVVDWQVEEGVARVEVKLPAVLTITREACRPRGMSMMGVVQARGKPITIWSAEDLEIDPATCGLQGSPTQMGDMWMPESGRRQELLEGEIEDVVDELLQHFCELGVLPEPG
jgi:electron transfer flavoprotein beta subunit